VIGDSRDYFRRAGKVFRIRAPVSANRSTATLRSRRFRLSRVIGACYSSGSASDAWN